MREISSTSLISASRWRPALTMRSTLSVAPAGSGSSCSSWPKPRIELSGVRSSWLMRERKSLLARLARSASSLAWRTAASAVLRSVMSVEMPATA